MSKVKFNKVAIAHDASLNRLKGGRPSRACPLCGGLANEIFTATDENHRISLESFLYLKCLVCEGIFLSNPPHDIGRYYKNEYYAIPSLERLQEIGDKDRNKIQTILRFASPPGRLLEIGPAFGVFAWQAEQAGFAVDVIEMDTACCQYLQEVLGLNVFQSNNPVASIELMGQHDVIAIWHVLEHLLDVVGFLRVAAHNLKQNGLLVIAMPNPDAWQFRIMGRSWPHLDAPRHMTLIPQKWLSMKAAELGLEQVYLTSDDSDAQSWNRFSWQRLLMNRFSSRFMRRVMYILGYALSFIMSPFDRNNFNGSAYTIAFKKK